MTTCLTDNLMKTSVLEKIKRFLNYLYHQIVQIDDTPQKIALGYGLGVFLGVFPGTGPLAAVFIAAILKVNRASAFLGSLLTNSWITWIIVVPAVKLGSLIFGRDWQLLLESRGLAIILPLITGYILVALALGFLAYLVSLIIINLRRANFNRKKSP